MIHCMSKLIAVIKFIIREENELKWPSILKFGFKNNTASKIAAYNAKIDPERKYPPQQLQVTSAARAEAAGVTK